MQLDGWSRAAAGVELVVEQRPASVNGVCRGAVPSPHEHVACAVELGRPHQQVDVGRRSSAHVPIEGACEVWALQRNRMDTILLETRDRVERGGIQHQGHTAVRRSLHGLAEPGWHPHVRRTQAGADEGPNTLTFQVRRQTDEANAVGQLGDPTSAARAHSLRAHEQAHELLLRGLAPRHSYSAISRG